MIPVDLEIEPFDPSEATETDLAGWHRVMAAWWRKDKPDLPPLTYEDCVGRLHNPFPGFGPEVKWVARHRGEVVGTATVNFLEGQSSHVGLVEIVVHPLERRQGIGTAMFARLLPELRAHDRKIVEGWQLTFGGDGPKWALARGFRTANTVLLQTLEIVNADSALWDMEVPAGYFTRRWMGAAPEDLVASYAEAREAIHDAPLGDMAYQEPEWTVDSVRARESELRTRDVEQRVVVAVHQATGVVVGVTELEVHPNGPLRGYQRDTAVLPAHRGHGLGRCIKAEMIRWLLADRPGFQRLQTTTGRDNVHMSRVNLQLGFKTARTTLAVNGEVDELESRLG